MKKQVKNQSMVSLITMGDKKSPVSEQYRTIRTNIQFAIVDRELKTLAITSSGPSEGKSTTSANLAVVFANTGMKVLLVDGDMRKPTVAKTFQVSNQSGLSSVLVNRDLRIEDVCQTSGVENLILMTSGPKPANPAELLGSKRMSEIIDQAKEYFDLVIFDLPPAVAVTDAQVVASQVDGTILVVREGVSNKSSLSRSKKLLDMVNAKIIGAIYNGVARDKAGSYYYYYGE